MVELDSEPKTDEEDTKIDEIFVYIVLMKKQPTL